MIIPQQTTTAAMDAALTSLNARTNPVNPPTLLNFSISVVTVYLQSIVASELLIQTQSAILRVQNIQGNMTPADIADLQAIAAKYGG